MAGWLYLPRFVDKIRLSEAGKLDADYLPNFLHKGFDAKWLETAGLEAEEFVAVVKGTLTDGEVTDWIRENVEADESTRAVREGAKDQTEAHAHSEGTAEMPCDPLSLYPSKKLRCPHQQAGDTHQPHWDRAGNPQEPVPHGCRTDRSPCFTWAIGKS